MLYRELNGKTALVTGGSRGFGRAIAERLANEGCTVFVNYKRSKSEAEDVVDSIQKAGGKAFALRGDVGKEEKIQHMFKTIKSETGQLDILIPNASFGIPGELMGTTSKYWEVTMNATARSLVLLAQESQKLMKGWGRIVTGTSYGGQRVLNGYGIVGPAKAAVESLTRSLAVELAPKGILVNGVMPGVSGTKSFLAIPGAESVLEEGLTRSPIKRLVSPEEVGNVVAFLCSNQADMICGQFIVIDGGTFILGY